MFLTSPSHETIQRQADVIRAERKKVRRKGIGCGGDDDDAMMVVVTEPSKLWLFTSRCVARSTRLWWGAQMPSTAPSVRSSSSMENSSWST